MIRVTDATGVLAVVRRGAVVAPADAGLGSLFAVDVLRRTAELLRLPLATTRVPDDLGRFNIKPSTTSDPATLELSRAGAAAEGEELAVRLAWLAGEAVEQATAELAQWRALVAGWAEEPSKPMCAQVQEDLVATLADDLSTRRAVEVLRGSLALDLPPGCLFETWAWADRLLALDLAADVGR